MLDYIEKKRFSGEDSHTISARKMMAMAKVPVELPNALDFSRRPVDDLPNANLNLDRTVGGFNAIQMKQRNVDRSESGVSKIFLDTECPTIEYSLCFGCFLSFQSSYREVFYHFLTAQETRIPKLTLLSSLCQKLIKLHSKT